MMMLMMAMMMVLHTRARARTGKVKMDKSLDPAEILKQWQAGTLGAPSSAGGSDAPQQGEGRGGGAAAGAAAAAARPFTAPVGSRAGAAGQRADAPDGVKVRGAWGAGGGRGALCSPLLLARAAGCRAAGCTR